MEMEKIIREEIKKEMQECYYSKPGLNEAEKYMNRVIEQIREKKWMVDVRNIGGKHTI